MTTPTPTPDYYGVATTIMRNGREIIVCAEDLEALKTYAPDGEARVVAIILGPIVQAPVAVEPSPAQRLAEWLHGNEMGKEINDNECATAKAQGLVVVFGYSDDVTEFRGAIHDEVGLGTINFTKDGKFIDDDRLEELEGLVHDGVLPAMPVMNFINATFGIAGHRYATDIPHHTFDVMEDGELFCRGIVFSIFDLK